MGESFRIPLRRSFYLFFFCLYRLNSICGDVPGKLSAGLKLSGGLSVVKILHGRIPGDKFSMGCESRESYVVVIRWGSIPIFSFFLFLQMTCFRFHNYI